MTAPDPQIVLHHYPGNASLAPHIVLRELALPFDLRLVDRTRMAHKAPDYLALNPNGQIPVLQDGDLVLFEAAAICLHLADKWPQAGLLPPLGSDARAQAYKWLVWMTNTLQATLMHYFYPERLVAAGHAQAADEVRHGAQARVGTLLDQLEDQLLQHGQAWLLGADHSVVDAYGFMLCRWTRGFEGTASPPARARPTLAAWLLRMQGRAAVQAAMAAEGLPQPWV